MEAAASSGTARIWYVQNKIFPPGILPETDKSQVADQRAAQRAIEDIETNGEESQEESGQAAIEQE